MLDIRWPREFYCRSTKASGRRERQVSRPQFIDTVFEAKTSSLFHGDFLLKLDADSLLIGPFSEVVGTFLASHPHCGVCGTLGRTSAREHKTYGYELRLTSPLVQMIPFLPPAQWRYISSLSERVLLDYARKGSPP